LLSRTTESTLSDLGMDLLDEHLYGTIRAIRGKNPLHGINAKYREAHIRRLCNQSKSFDSFDDFIAANGTHELKPYFIEIPSPDKPYVNYLVVKRLIELEEPMEIYESEESLNNIDEPTELDMSIESMEADESEESLNSIDEPTELDTSTESMEADESEEYLNSIDELMEISFDLQENAEFVEGVYLMMSDQFHTIVHSGLSARTNCLIVRFYENAANFSPYTHGMIRFIDRTTEMAERFNFDSLF